MRITKKKIAVVAAGTAVAVGGAGVAFAFFTADGTGTGSASTGTSTPWVITSEAAEGDALTPGGGSQTVAFSVMNDNSGVQSLGDVVVTVAEDDGSAWASGTCGADDFTVTSTVTKGQVVAGASATGTVTISLKNLAENQDDCQDVTVPLYFVAS